MVVLKHEKTTLKWWIFQSRLTNTRRTSILQEGTISSWYTQYHHHANIWCVTFNMYIDVYINFNISMRFGARNAFYIGNHLFFSFVHSFSRSFACSLLISFSHIQTLEFKFWKRTTNPLLPHNIHWNIKYFNSESIVSNIISILKH